MSSDAPPKDLHMMRRSMRSLHSVSASLVENTTPVTYVDEKSGAEANSRESRLAYCNSSCLSENLGQVRYIFSDKTGTLTKNDMILKYCHVLNHQSVLWRGLTGRIEINDTETKTTLEDETAVVPLSRIHSRPPC